MRRRAIGAVLLASAGLAACGGDEAAATPEAAIRALFADLEGALGEKDFERVCGLLSDAQRTEVAAGAGCATRLETALGGVEDPSTVLPVAVDRIDFEGADRAIVRSPDGKQTKVRRFDGRWRLAADSDY